MSLITLRQIKKAYGIGTDNELEILKGIDLTIEKGEFVAIMGPSGSGKSTLMHILGFLDRPTSGTYLFDEQDVTGLSNDELAQIRNRKIGFVFQAFNLLPRTTAIENVMLPMLYARTKSGGHIRDAAKKMLKRVSLGDRMLHVPSQLSGGQQQRVAIARALINDPKVIFADEPTGNLDSRSSIEVMDLFKELNDSGHTIIFVTHEDSVAQYASRIIRLKDGEIVGDKKQ